MEKSRFAIAYSPGCFGKLLDTTIKIQLGLNPKFNPQASHSHDEFASGPDVIKHFHKEIFSQEEEKEFSKSTTLFPYFPQTHRFVAPYMNYCKFFGGLPQINDFEKYNIKSLSNNEKIGCTDREVYLKAVVTHFWQKAVKIPANVLPLNLLDFFTDLEIFITNLEKLLEQKLTQQALEFISAKQKANLAIFNKHEQSITGNTATEDILDCFRIAMHIDYDVAKYSSFLKNPTQYLSSIPIEDK